METSTIRDKIMQIKYLRMKPEQKYIYDILMNLDVYYMKHKSHMLYGRNSSNW